MSIEFNKHQVEAAERMKNGCILVGDVGSGKSRTSLVYYCKSCGTSFMYDDKRGEIDIADSWDDPRDLYIITTAKKRDSEEWEDELESLYLTREYLKYAFKKDGTPTKVTIDSWNNIKKYKDVAGAFFIFDEQRVVGSGAWVKAFLNIARKNRWILLSATPGDQWSDYIPVFVANGFYKNKTEFTKKHCIYSRFTTYPKIERYVDEGELLRHKADISIPLPVDRHTKPYHIYMKADYDKVLWKRVWKDRWDPWEEEPIEETGKLFYLLRKVANDNDSRYDIVRDIAKSHKRIIIFYNFSYELRRLRQLAEELEIVVGEWNGELHTEVPRTDKWFYLVQYSAGCEGWNCITTDTMIFFSQSYSYRMMKQAEGRINRMNTPYEDLFYYHLTSAAPIDLAIKRALTQKRNFNENTYLKVRRR
jgi:hypothetical protein